jgi:thiol-disulfide isomerase/thioredoxin
LKFPFQWLIALAFFSVANNVFAQGKISFDISVTNSNRGSVKIGIRHLFDYQPETVKLIDGNCSKSFEIKENSVDLIIDYGTFKFESHIAVGSVLKISFDAKNPEKTLLISGNGPVSDRYETLFNRTFCTAKWRNESDSLLWNAVTWKSLVTRTFSITNKELSTLENFKAQLTTSLYNKFYFDIFYVNFNKALVSNFIENHPEYKDSIIIMMNKFKRDSSVNLINDSAVLLSANYRNFIRDYFYKYSKQELQRFKNIRSIEYLSYSERLFAFVDVLFDNNKVKEWIKANLIGDLLDQQPLDEVQPVYIRYMTSSSNNEYKSYLALKYSQVTGNLNANDMISELSDLIFQDKDGRNVRFGDLLGKKEIYMEFWATWCGPCIDEIKNHLPKIAAELDSRNILLLSISIDENISSWKKVLTNLNIPGLQLNAAESANEIKDLFHIYSVPKYIVIDKSGRVINNAAPSPSELQQNTARLTSTFGN